MPAYRSSAEGEIRDAVVARIRERRQAVDHEIPGEGGMTWYAIRTAPGAQQPTRERWAEPTASALDGRARGKGYRIASSTNPERSAVERALERDGFTCYMPAEFAAVRNRDNKGLYRLRRFALLKGYAFVAELSAADWRRLLAVPGVLGYVADSGGKAIAIDPMDIHRLRMYEANSRAEAQAKVDSLSRADERLLKEHRKTIAKAARKKLFPGRDVKLIWGEKVGREATVAAWHDHETVRVILHGLETAETVTVPFEFLKAAE